MSESTLEGIWQPVFAELNGEEAPQMALQKMALELRDGRYAVRFGGETSDAGSYEIDAAGIILHGLDGPNAGRKIPALFKFAGGALSICYGLDGVRPSDFNTRSGPPRYLVNYRRLDEVEAAGSPF